VNERANGDYETSFLPGRKFSDVADFNAQLHAWLKRANRRVHATTRMVPVLQIYEDRGSMNAFPPVLPDPGRARPRLGSATGSGQFDGRYLTWIQHDAFEQLWLAAILAQEVKPKNSL
jgi:hypothetical protein